MRKLLVFAVGFLLLSSAGAGAAPSEVTIINSTGFEIEAFYIAPTEWGEWGDDLLADATIEDGGRRTFSLGDLAFEKGQRNFDLRIVDVDGDEYAKYDVDLGENATVTFTFDDYVETKTENGGSADHYNEGYSTGYDEGFEKGKQAGFKEGYGQGFKDGYKEGSKKPR